MTEPFDRSHPLAALTQAHRDLTSRQPAEADSVAFLDACAEFVDRAKATGALLDSHADRVEAQSLVNYWATRLIRGGRQVDDTTLADFDISLSPELGDALCPYRGLVAFSEGDKDYFFGRGWVVDQMIAKLRDGARLLAVVGSSGSGKSSVVLAGLVPVLKAGALPGSQDWQYVTLVPGSDPAANLDVATRGRSSQPLVLVIDQFEEIFTLCTEESKRNAFVDAVVECMRAPQPCNIVVITMRTEYVDNVVRLPELWPLFRAARVDVEAMGNDELRAAIERPAERVGLKFAAGIVDDLVNTILGERAGLPLLQFTLLKLWKKRQRNRITWDAYKEVGNPREALERSAELFYLSLLPQDQDTVKRILLKMVRPAAGLEFTSNRIPRLSVFEKNVSPVWVEDVLVRLIGEGLVKETHGATDADAQIEVSHEALVRNWPRLVTWLDDERASLRERFLLEDMARRWQDREHDQALLLRGRLLEEAERLSDLGLPELALIQASRAAADAERQEREEAQQRELQQARALAEEQQRRADLQADAARQLRRLLRVVALGAVLTLGLLVWALVAQTMATQANFQEISARSTAEAGRIVQATSDARAIEVEATRASDAKEKEELNRRVLVAHNLLYMNAVRGMLVALETLQADQSMEAEDVLREALREGPRLLIHSSQTDTILLGAEFLPDGRRLVTIDTDGVLNTWDMDSRQMVGEFRVPAGTFITTLQAMPDGRRLWMMGADGTARIFDLEDGEVLSTTTFPTNSEVAVTFAQLSGDGRRVATVHSDNSVRVWDAASGALIQVIGGASGRDGAQENGLITRARFSPDGTRVIVSRDDGTSSIIDVTTGQEPGAPLRVADIAFTDARFSPDGRHVSAAGSDGAIYLWDLTSPQPSPRKLSGHDDSASTVQFSADGRYIVSTGVDGTARVWNGTTGQEVRVLRGHTGEVLSARLSPDGANILTLGSDGNVVLWDARGGAEVGTLMQHSAPVSRARFSADGTRAITAGQDGTARVWDAQTGRLITQTTALDSELVDIAHSPQGDRFVTAGADGVVRVWDAQTADQLLSIRAHDGAVTSASFSPDGQRILTAGEDGIARVWSVETGQSIAKTPDRTPVINDARFSPQGDRFATAGEDGMISMWDAVTAKEISTFQASSYVSRVAIAPDGQSILSVSSVGVSPGVDAVQSDAIAQVWDAVTGEAKFVLSKRDIKDAAFSPDGRHIVTASHDGKVLVWDAQDGEAISTSSLLQAKDVQSIQYSPNGQSILIAGSDGVARIFLLSSDLLLAEAATRLAGETLTCEERVGYLKERLDCPVIVSN